MAVYAFTLDWGNWRGYAFPPFKLIHRCLLKIWKDQADVLLLTPVWPAQPWWPTIMELAYQPLQYLETGGESFVGSGREPSFTVSSRVVAYGRLGLIRQSFEKRGLSGKVVHLLLAGRVGRSAH